MIGRVNGGASAADDYELSFNMYRSNAYSSTLISVGNEDASSNGMVDMYLFIEAGSILKLYDGSSWIDSGLRVYPNEWNQVRLASDISTNTYNVYVTPQGGAESAGETPQPLMMTNREAVNRIEFNAQSYDYMTYVDDVQLSSVAPSPPAVNFAVNYTFKETSPGSWNVLADVTGDDTAGLAGYEIWVDGVDPATVSFTENTLGSASKGFLSSTLVQGDVGGSFNAGNYQFYGTEAILGIGMEAVDEAGVVLDAQALLGTLATGTGLTPDNFRATVAGLLNAVGDGFLNTDELIPSVTVIPYIDMLFGDANGDGVVSAGDYASVQSHFGESGAQGIPGDANGDGVVSAGDYACIQANFGNTAPAGITPEPVSLSMLGLGGLILLARRSRTHR